MVSAGTQLVWSGTVNRGISDVATDASQLAADIGSALSAYNIEVLSYDYQTPDILTQIGELGFYSYTLKLTVAPTVDYSQASDIQANIDHVVYSQTGYMPSSSSITSVGGVSTGNPSAPAPANALGAAASDVGSAVGSALQGVSSGFVGSLGASGTTLLILALVVIGGLLYVEVNP